MNCSISWVLFHALFQYGSTTDVAQDTNGPFPTIAIIWDEAVSPDGS